MITRKQKTSEVITIAKGNQKLTLHREDSNIISAEAEFTPFGGKIFASPQSLSDIADVLNLAVAEFKKYPAVEAAPYE